MKNEIPFAWLPLPRLLLLLGPIILTGILHAANAVLFPLERTLISTYVYVASFLAICRLGFSFLKNRSSAKREQPPVTPPPPLSESKFTKWTKNLAFGCFAEFSVAALFGSIGFAAGTLAGAVWWYLGGFAYNTLMESCLIGGAMGAGLVVILLGGG